MGLIVKVLDRLLVNFDCVSPQTRRRWALAVLIVSVVAWPTSQFTVSRDVDPVLLGISWGAIILTSIDVLFTSDVRKEVDDRGEVQ